MKKLLLLGALLASGAIGLQDVSVGHGGTYRGPGDTVPPGGGGRGGGGGPTSPTPSGPSGPGPSGPTSPRPGGPGAPGAGPGGPSAPGTGGGSASLDLTLWQFWWGFNKDPYLNLKSHIHSRSTLTGSDDFFLGHGQQAQSKDSLRPSEATIRNKIVPALLHALETENNNDIVTGAMIALAKIGKVGDEVSEDGESKFQAVILPFLRDSNQEIAETAAVALGVLGNPVSVPDLKYLLLDTASERMRLVGSEAGVDYRTRAFAAFGLGQIGYNTTDPAVRQDIVNALWQICESPRMATRDIKVAAVIAMGLVPLDVKPMDAAVVEQAGGQQTASAPTNRGEQIQYLIDFFQAEKDKNKHYLVRAHAPRAIAKLLGGLPSEQYRELKKQVVAVLEPYVSKRGHIGQRELRQSASLAFGQLGDLDGDEEDVIIRTALMEATGNRSQQVKFFSVIALGQLGGHPGDNGEDPFAGLAEVRKTLMTHLARGGTQVRPWAGLAIGVMERGLLDQKVEQSEASLLALRSALKRTKTIIEVGAYAIACGIARDTDAEAILLDKLDTMADDEVRGNIAIGLGLMNSVAALQDIQEVVSKSKYRGELLKQAAIALGLLGDKKVVTSLIAQLEEAKTLTTQAAIASALGFIGDTRSVDPLVEMLGDQEKTGPARGFAAVALGIVAEREILPWNSKFAVDINYRANTRTLTGGGGMGLLDIL